MGRGFVAFFLPLGCIGLSSSFIVVSLVMFLFYKFKYSLEIEFHKFIDNRFVKYSYMAMSIWMVCMFIVSIFNNGDNQTFAYIQRMIMFFIVGIYFCTLADKKNFFEAIWVGICCASLVLSLDNIYSFFMLDKWRPNSNLLGNPNKLGGYLILILPFLLAGLYEYYSKKKLFIFGSLSSMLVFVALIISGSRGAMIGFISSICIMSVILLAKGFSEKRKYIKTFLKVVSFILVVGFAFYYLKPDFFIHSSDSERKFLWISAINMITDYPWTGVGLGNFNNVYVNGYISPFAVEPRLTSPHNIFLHYFVNLGILGGSSFIILIITQIYVLVKNIKNDFSQSIWIVAGLVSVLGMVIHGMVDTLITTRPYAMMYWLLYGVACCNIIRGEVVDEK